MVSLAQSTSDFLATELRLLFCLIALFWLVIGFASSNTELDANTLGSQRSGRCIWPGLFALFGAKFDPVVPLGNGLASFCGDQGALDSTSDLELSV